MIELRLFGGFECSGPDRERARSLAAQPRRSALLVHLAVQGLRGPLRRDQLAEFFWPGGDSASSRQSLRQALAFLRKALGERAIVTRADARGEEEVAIDPIEVRCDVPAFERYFDAGDLVRAVEVYRGDLLAGFPATGVDAFDRWLDERRDEYRGRVRAALKTLAEREDAAGNGALAIHWSRRELALEPADEDTAMRLMRRLAAAGQRAEALSIYEEQRRHLAEALGDEPSPELSALAAEIQAMPVGAAPVAAPEPPASRGDQLSSQELLAAPAPAQTTRPRARPLGLVAAAVSVVLILIALASRFGASSTTAATAPHDRKPFLSIQPFRVDGTEAALAHLGQGVVDLLTNRLGADPGWKVERDVRGTAGEILTGSVVGVSNRIVVEAMLRGSDGTVHVTVSAEGPVDSLSAIMDRIAAKLLFYRAAYEPAFPDELARRPFVALQEFLLGHEALRRGQHAVALQAFERALAADSGLAQASLGLAAAGRRLGEWEPWQRGLAKAFAQRARLGRADSLYLIALTGTRYPRTSPHVENLAAWQAAVEAAPDRPAGWYELGDYLLRWGPVMGILDARTQAKAALSRAIALDSGLVEAVLPLMEIAMIEGDTSAVLKLRGRYLPAGEDPGDAGYLRWRVAVFLGDSAARARLRSSFDRQAYPVLVEIVGMAQVAGVGLDDASRVVEILRQRSVRLTEAVETREIISNWDLNRGAFGAAVEQRMSVAMNRGQLRLIMLDALYAGGDTTAAREAFTRLMATAHDSLAGLSPARQADVRATDVCIAEQWRLWHRERATPAAAVALLRAADRTENRACAPIIAGIDAVLAGARDAREKLEAMDLALRTGDPQPNDLMYGNIAAARLWLKLGDPRRALAAARRRPYHNWNGPWYLAALLDEERRSSAAVGDHANEQAAAKHLAALRAMRP